MRPMFEQIDAQQTEIGEISLRRRRIPALTTEDIYEVKLGDEFLMSSLFVKAEEALTDLGLAACPGDELRVVVGGLGLGHTAAQALQSERLAKLWVVELLAPVIDWHRRCLVPLGDVLNKDNRCQFIQGSFFDLAQGKPTTLVPDQPTLQLDAILLDIDHSPEAVLDDGNLSFYHETSLALMARQIKPGGVFAMWSNDPPDDAFADQLRCVFATVQSEVIRFYNPFQNREATATIYVAKTPAD